ncbi:MAG: peptidylprolyl isomerase [Planctomycetota bacterium]
MRTPAFTAVAAAVATLAAGVCQAQDDAAESDRILAQLVYVTLETSMGDILIELDHENAPVSTQNFVQYVEDDFYDGTVFHRAIGNFMIQGGGFDTEGNKKPTRDGIANEWRNGLSNEIYTIAMARLGGQPNSGTSQFFINVKDNAFLDQPRDGSGYAVFGVVVDGTEVVDSIKGVSTGSKNGMGDWPTEDVVINDAVLMEGPEIDELREKRIAEREEARLAAEREVRERTEKQLAEANETIKSLDLNPEALVFKEDLGIYMLVIEEGSGDNPQPTDTVRVHYTGWLTNGNKFDSSRDRGEPAEFPLNRVIPGWTRGVGDMKPGDRRILVIPHELAYGPAGRPPVIPQSAMLIFDVELLEVK